MKEKIGAGLALSLILGLSGCKEEPRTPPAPKNPAVTRKAPPKTPAKAPKASRKPATKKLSTVSELVLNCAVVPEPKAIYSKVCVFPKGSMKERDQASEGLAAMGAPAVAALRRVMGPKNKVAVRSWAVTTLKRMGSQAKAAIPELLAILEDSSPFMAMSQSAVVSALGQMGPDGAAAVPALLKYQRRNPKRNSSMVADALGNIGRGDPEVVAFLRSMLGSPKSFYRALAARAIGQLEPKATMTIPLLKKLLSDEKEKTQIYAAGALYRIGGSKDKSLLSRVEKGLSHKNWQIRQAAALAMGALCGSAPEAEKALLKIATSEKNLWIQSAIAASLGRLEKPSDKTIKQLLAFAKRSGAMPSVAAIHALGRLGKGARSALPTLKQILAAESGSSKGREASLAISRISS